MVVENKKSSNLAEMTTESEQKSKGISLNLSPAARQVVDRIRQDTGVPNTEAMTRILEWFSSLDKKLRLAILNKDEETRYLLLREALAQMTGLANENVPATLDEAAITARIGLDRLEHLARTYQREATPDAPKAKRSK